MAIFVDWWYSITKNGQSQRAKRNPGTNINQQQKNEWNINQKNTLHYIFKLIQNDCF